MPYVYQTFDKDGNPHPLWRFQYRDWRGEKRKLTGYRSEAKTRDLAERIEGKHRLIRAGELPRPKECDKPRDFWETVQEYLAWGRQQGGKGGRSWAAQHADKREHRLAFWRDRLALEDVADLIGILPRVEATVRELAFMEKVNPHTGEKERVARSSMTLGHYTAALRAFGAWAFLRGYIEDDPLKRLKPPPRIAKNTRRALNVQEIRNLLENCAPHRRLTYELALASGLRANELRSLTIQHLDVERGGLRLDAAWTKNRKKAFQSLHPGILLKLAAAVERGDAAKAYERAHAKARAAGHKVKWTPPANPLVYVGSHPARDLDYDLKRAGILKWGPGGKLDFHGCRVAYATMADEENASGAERRDLMRHATVDQTSLYTRSRDARIVQVAEAIGAKVLGPDAAPTEPPRQAVGAEYDPVTEEGAELCGVESGDGSDPHALPPSKKSQQQTVDNSPSNHAHNSGKHTTAQRVAGSSASKVPANAGLRNTSAGLDSAPTAPPQRPHGNRALGPSDRPAGWFMWGFAAAEALDLKYNSGDEIRDEEPGAP